MKSIMRIYALVDPRDESYFYVGRTSYILQRRLVRHRLQGKIHNSKKDIRFKEILASGNHPEIVELAVLNQPSPEQAIATEQAWIDWLGFRCSLTNDAPASGGKGDHEKTIKWSDEIISRLGNEMDEAIAKDIGCCSSVINEMRWSLGIEKFHTKKWTEENIALLGKITDAELSKKIGCSITPVARKRNKLGIKPCPRKKYPQRYNKHNWTDYQISQLGKDIDKNIAKKLNLSLCLITNKRKELKIKPYKLPIGYHATKLTKETINLLGELSDKKLAVIAGVNFSVIRTARINRGIKSYDEQNNLNRFKNK